MSAKLVKNSDFTNFPPKKYVILLSPTKNSYFNNVLILFFLHNPENCATFAMNLFFSTMIRRLFLVATYCSMVAILFANPHMGHCGDNLFWSFDTVTSHLDITGRGDMNLTKYPAWTAKDFKITSVSFSDSITSIDSYAFEEQALEAIVVPASVTKFGKEVFKNNLQLLHFEYLGNKCINEDHILYNCKSLRYFKGSVRMLYYCDAIDTVIVTHEYAYTNFYGPSYIDDSKAYDTRLYGKNVETPKEVKTLFLPDSLETIGHFLLYNAYDLGGITIPTKVHLIDKCAFMNCFSLDSVVFTSDVIETIADSAFAGCQNLSYISLPDTVPPTIFAHTFDSVSRAIPIYIPQGTAQRYQEAPYWSEFTNFVEPELTTDADHSIDLSNPSISQPFKYFHNSQLYIHYRGKEYSITGQLILTK